MSARAAGGFSSTSRPTRSTVFRYSAMEASFAALRPGGRLVTNVGTLEMLSATYGVLKRLAGRVEVLLMNLSRGVEQLEALRFESVNPTFLLRVQKPADWVV